MPCWNFCCRIRCRSTLLVMDPIWTRSASQTPVAPRPTVVVPYVVLISPAGEISTNGTATVGGRVPVSLADHVRIGSITKTWTGTVILQQAQQGKLSLDDPVSKFRPDVPDGDHITIAELLNMRSGLYNYTETRELNETGDSNPQKVWNADELLALAYSHPPYSPPGTGYHYSNTNTVLLGLIAETLDAKPLSQVFHDRLFTPLGLKDTLFPASTSSAIPDPHPQGYMYGNNVLTMGSPAAVPPEMQAAAKAGTLQPSDQTSLNPSWAGRQAPASPPWRTWLPGLRRWPKGNCSIPTCKPGGSPACSQRTRHNPMRRNTGWPSRNSVRCMGIPVKFRASIPSPAPTPKTK